MKITKYKSIFLSVFFPIIGSLSAEKPTQDRIDLSSIFTPQIQHNYSYLPQKNDLNSKQSNDSTSPNPPSQPHNTSPLDNSSYATLCEVGNVALHVTIPQERHTIHNQPYKQDTLNPYDYPSYNLYNQNTVAYEKIDPTTKNFAKHKQTKKALRKKRSRNRRCK